MKKKFLFAFMAMIILSGTSTLQAQNSENFRIMSYNVRNGKGMDLQVCGYSRTAAAINGFRPDVVMVQELDSVTTRSKGKYTLGCIAKLTGMYATFSPSIDYDGGKYGIGLLSKEKPIAFRYISLPGREETRSLLMVELSGCICCCTHLSLTDEDRMLSIPIIEEAVSEFAKDKGKPVFLAGDWNDTPDSGFIAGMEKYWQILTNIHQPTFPAPEPEITIDYIALWKEGPSAETCCPEVVNEPMASDHRPVTIFVTDFNPTIK